MALPTQVVVLPNMLATIRGLSSAGGTSASTMPQIAPAARAKTSRLILLTPATSTIDGTITISRTPT